MTRKAREGTQTIAARAMRHVGSKRNERTKGVELSTVLDQKTQDKIDFVDRKYKEKQQEITERMRKFDGKTR